MSRSDIEECEIFEVDVHCCLGKEDRSLGFYDASIGEIVIGKKNSEYGYFPLSASKLRLPAIVVKIQSKSSCPDASLKIFLEDPAEIIQSAGEDQDVGISTAPQGRPVDALGNQDTSDLSGGPMPTTSVEDDDAMTGQVVEETPTPKEPSEWVSNLIDGVDTVEKMIDAFKDVSRFLGIDF